MQVEQISVFLENKPGVLEQVTGVLKEAGINIRTLTLADTADFGILRMIVNDVDTTARILMENGFRVSRTSVVGVEVPDRPGGLHGILSVLAGSGVNVEYMYAFVERNGENAVMIFRFDDPDRAIALLQESSLTVLPGEKLYAS
jgi:hypothetical protein